MFFKKKETQRPLDKQKICFPRLWVDGIHTSVYSSVTDLSPDTTYYHNGKFPPNSEEEVKSKTDPILKHEQQQQNPNFLVCQLNQIIAFWQTCFLWKLFVSTKVIEKRFFPP